MRSRKAIVIGGGIGGLAAAIALRNSGTDVTVYERTAELMEVGAGLSLWANALAALEQLGLGAPVRSLALPDLDGGIYTRNGRLIMSTTNQELAQQFGDYSVVVHRSELHSLLRDELGSTCVEVGKALVGFKQDTSSVSATFADGSYVRADLLVGADGLRSTVRARLHGDAPPRYAGYTAWRSVLAFDQAHLLPGETWGRGARFGRVPLKGGRVYWFATRNAPAGERAEDGEKAELLRTFADFHAPVTDLIEATDEAKILRHDIYDRPVLRTWGQGRVTLLGDAAHPMTPNLGQGACQALEDAVVLARCLREGESVPAGLGRYEKERKGRANALVVQSRRMGEVGQWSNPVATAARDALFARLPSAVRTRQLERVLRFEG